MKAKDLIDKETGVSISGPQSGFKRRPDPKDIEITETIKWDKDYFTWILISNAKNFEEKKFISCRDPNVEVHVNRFLRKVYTFSKYNSDYLSVIQGCLTEGPAYAERCKKGLIYGFIKQYSIDRVDEEVNKWDKVSSYTDIFPERHLIYWDEEDPEDYKYMNEYLATDSEELAKYKDTLHLLLKDITLKPVPDFIIKSEGGSSVIDDKLKFRGYKKLSSRDVNYSHTMKGYRALIKVGPANMRDAFVLEEASLNSVTLLSKLTKQIVSKLKWSSMKSKSEEDYIQLRARRAIEKRYCSYIRDFTKSGLTLPHEVLNATRDVLMELYPGSGFEFMDVLFDLKIRKDKSSKELLPVRRGHGLGMANEITTLIQCVLDEMNRNSINNPKDLITDIWNDDFRLIGLYPSVQAYAIADLERCEKLGFDVKHQKTALLQGATLFLEEYYCAYEGHNWNKKILLELTLDNAYYAYNVTHAKFLVRPDSTSLLEVEGLGDRYFDLYKHWGYEFYSREFFFSNDVGGWFDESYAGRKILFTSENFFESRPLQLMKAARAETIEPKLGLNKKLSPSKLGLENLNNPELSDYIRLVCPHADILTWNQKGIAHQIWRAVSEKRNQLDFWRNLAKERNAKYQERLEVFPSFEEVFNFVVKNNKGKVYAIPSEFVTEYGGNLEVIEYTNLSINQFLSESEDYGLINLESKVICSGEQSLSREERLEFNYRNRVLNDCNCEFIKTSRDNICKSEALNNYDFNLLTRNAFYLKRDNLVPVNISGLIELPNRREMYKVDDELLEDAATFEGLYPRTIKVDEVILLKKISERFEVPLNLLFLLVRLYEENITDPDIQVLVIDEHAENIRDAIFLDEGFDETFSEDDSNPLPLEESKEEEGDSDNEPYEHVSASSLIETVLGEDSESDPNEGDEFSRNDQEYDPFENEINMIVHAKMSEIDQNLNHSDGE